MTCALRELDKGGVAVVRMELRSTRPGRLESAATVSAFEADPDPTDNGATPVVIVGRRGSTRQ